METLYIVIGAFSSIFIFLLGYAVSGVFNGKKRVDDLEKYIEMTDMRISEVERELSQRLDKEIEDTHQTFRDVEIDLRSQLDSRLDKLTNQIIKKIPPTNQELIKRIEKIEEESYRLRMNM
jgi:phospholipid N-methyltransferase